ncbi:uncharacterized protein VNE69_11173 [Vairimorpha necatrix]|uniref:Tubulin-specific chaperone A n=1 Tax=Vairimorpha necatrix TaxID=6039 RepID=A0AAX4JG44_9MICR
MQGNLRDSKILRLKKEENMYVEEIKNFENNLNTQDKNEYIYENNLLMNQLEETKKALEQVQKRLKEFEGEADL